MAFANANIQSKGSTAPAVTPTTPVATPSATAPVLAPKKTALAMVSKFGKQKIHTYKLVLTAIISSVAAFSLQHMYSNYYDFKTQEYIATDTFAPVDLDAIARKRILTEADVDKLASQYERRLQDAEVQALLRVLKGMDGMNYEQWPQVQELLAQTTTKVQEEAVATFTAEQRLSPLHLEQITAVRTAEGFVKPELNNIQITAAAGVQEFKKGTRTDISTAYVHFKVDGELGYELTQQIATELDRLLPPEQISSLQIQLEDALLAAGIVPATVQEDLKAAAPMPTDEAVDPIEEPTEEPTKEPIDEPEVDPLTAVGVAEVVEVVELPVEVEQPVAAPEPPVQEVVEEEIPAEAVPETVQSSSSSAYFRVNPRALRENFDWYQKRFQ